MATRTEILDRITVKTYGLGASIEPSDESDDSMVIALANGQRFRISVRELAPVHEA